MAKEKGWDTVIQQYGNPKGAKLLAKELKINLKTLEKAIGAAEKLKELFDIPEDVQIDAWNMWRES